MTTPFYAEHPKFGLCRGLANHLFEVRFLQPRKADEVLIRLACRTCGTTREDCIEIATGRVEKRRYRYVPGYRLRQRNGRAVQKREVRAECVRWLLKKRGAK